jgi:hypothetical protein
MPKGGARPGSGRPQGALNKRHRVIVDDPTALLPIEWMLAVLRDPECEQSRRDQMAIQAAPYLHAKLNAIAVSSPNGNGHSGGGDVNIVQIFAVPRGARIEKDGTAITIDGAAVELKPLEPFTGTPALTDQRDQYDQRAEPEPVRFEVTELEPPANVSRLDTFRNRRDSEDGGGSGAA